MSLSDGKIGSVSSISSIPSLSSSVSLIDPIPSKSKSAQSSKSKSNKKTVNDAIRICVTCGNIAVKIQNHGIFCKDCGSFFDMEKNHDE